MRTLQECLADAEVVQRICRQLCIHDEQDPDEDLNYFNHKAWECQVATLGELE